MRATPIAVVLAGLPGLAAAHSFGQLYTLPVPFWLYAWTAAAALIVSFLIAGIFLTTGGPAPATPRQRDFPHRLPAWLWRALQALSLAGLLICMATGLFGTRQSYANLNMTFFWIVFVLGYAYLTAVIGNLYALINPWRSMVTGISRIAPSFGRARLVWPARLGYWPAAVLYGAFIWVELFGRTNPFTLSLWLGGYTVLNLGAAWLFGAQAWFQRGEIFAVMLRLIGRMAPVDFEGSDTTPTGRFRLRKPFSGLVGASVDHSTMLLFVLFLLSATAFDGLHETRPWVQLFWNDLYRELLSTWLGNNPMAALPAMFRIYPWWQSAWLFLSPLLYLAGYLMTIEFMRWITGRRQERGELARRFLHSLLPIVLVYHVTHYYTLIQTQGVKVIALVSDPFGFGWNLLGTATWMRGSIIPDMNLVWHTQVALLLSGHIASVVVAHLEALRVFPDRKTATLSQLPMLALMVAFTVFGLWILSLPLETVRRLD